MANIQIHELNSHVGSLTSSDYLATDNGTNTTKIPVTDVSALAVDEAVAQAVPEAVSQAQVALSPTIEAMAVLVISIPSFSSLPLTISNSNITSDMVALNSELGTPSAQTGVWTVTTSNGSLTVSGSISSGSSTSLKLYLMKSR